MELIVRRLSDSEDRIPVMVSERLIDVTQDYTGEYIEIHGQFRSYNRHEEKHNRLVLSVFAREVRFVEEYVKRISENQSEKRIAYEVSVSKLEYVD
jgi:Cft2 family RNA processing exonuclease